LEKRGPTFNGREGCRESKGRRGKEGGKGEEWRVGEEKGGR